MSRTSIGAIGVTGVALTVLASTILAACASSSSAPKGALAAYDNMTPVKTTRVKALIYADPKALSAAHTVRIAPVVFAPGVGADVSAEQDALIANVIGRTLCTRLNRRYTIVTPDAPADLTVKVAITRLAATGRAAAGASTGLRVAGMIVGFPGLRLPIGLGAFSAESEVVGADGARDAAMVWSRGADMFTSAARVSKIGDAYELSDNFAADMARLIVTGKNPLHDLPKGAPGEDHAPSPVCEAYGKAHRAETFVSRFVGAPPEFTDKGAVKPAAPNP